jgi:hypothetical protein
VLKYIKAFGGQYGEDTGETLAERIYALDRTKTLDSGQRSIMMAIYKALNVIRKNGAPAVGAAVRTNETLTMGRLLDLAETFNKRVDISVGDNAEYYGMRMIDRLADNINSYMNEINGFMDTDVEEVLERIEQTERIDDIEQMQQARELAQKTTALENVPASLLRELQKAAVPVTVNNITAYRRVSNGRLFCGGEINNGKVNEAVDETADDTSLEKLGEKGYNDYISDIYAAVTSAADEDLNDLEKVNEMMRAMRLLYSIASATPYKFYVPVKFNNALADVNMYITGDLDSMENISVVMLLHSSMGETHIRMDLNGKDGITARMSVNNTDEGYTDGLMAELSEITQPDAVINRSAPVLNELPAHVRKAASAALKYAERIEKVYMTNIITNI